MSPAPAIRWDAITSTHADYAARAERAGAFLRAAAGAPIAPASPQPLTPSGLVGEGVTVFVTTHYLDEAEHCHRLALMHAGRIAAMGTVSVEAVASMK